MIPENLQKQIDFIADRCEEIKPIVVISCITFNHELYLKDALEGFVNQKTNFPYVAIVHEDASTDKTADILKKYAEKYPNIIFPIYEKENQYSKKDGSLYNIINKAIDASNPKYVALCEGDDYWNDPHKLQKQVDFLDFHDDYTLCATNHLYQYPDGKKTESPYNVNEDRDSDIKEVILKGGMFLSTSSLVIRKEAYNKLPESATKLPVGDYPLQIYMAYLGKVRILYASTVVYRVQSNGSWSAKYSMDDFKTKFCLFNYAKEINSTMNQVTKFEYNKIFEEYIIIREFNLYFKYSPLKECKLLFKRPVTIFKRLGIRKVIFSILPIKIKNLILK